MRSHTVYHCSSSREPHSWGTNGRSSLCTARRASSGHALCDGSKCLGNPLLRRGTVVTGCRTLLPEAVHAGRPRLAVVVLTAVFVVRNARGRV